MFLAALGFVGAVAVSIAFPTAWSRIVVVVRAGGNAVIPIIKRVKIAIERQ